MVRYPWSMLSMLFSWLMSSKGLSDIRLGEWIIVTWHFTHVTQESQSFITSTLLPCIAMSLASSSSVRSFAHRSLSALTYSTRSASTETASNDSYSVYQPRPFSPNRDNVREEARPPRPESSVHFTGQPSISAGLHLLENTLSETLADLRRHHLYPLPADLKLPILPPAKWKKKEELYRVFGGKLKHAQFRRVSEILSQLHRNSYIAEMAGKHGLAQKTTQFLNRYARSAIVLMREERKEASLDAYGRALGAGRRKTASARVWIIPAKSALPYLDADPATVAAFTQPPAPVLEENEQPEKKELPELPMGEILVNQMALPKYFYKLSDRQSLLRPLRLTGLLGAYNVFALAQGGGPTGQAEAIALALARALVVARPETRAVLRAGKSCFTVTINARRSIVKEPKDGREEEDQFAQGQKGGKSSSQQAHITKSSSELGSSVSQITSSMDQSWSRLYIPFIDCTRVQLSCILSYFPITV